MGADLRAGAGFFAADDVVLSGACATRAVARPRAMQSFAAVAIMMFSIDGRGDHSVGREEWP
jgi:hypothetical protein